MIRKFKTLGIAMVAVLALSAVVASAASAANFTASTYPTSATASSAKGNDIFSTEGGKVECKSHFHIGPLAAASPSVTVDPTYTECQAFGFVTANVNMNNCDYTFFQNGVVDVTCEAGEGPITITAGTCEVQIHGSENEGLTSVELNNVHPNITAKAKVTGIDYTVTKDGFGCPFGGTGKRTGATYTQTNAVTVAATNGATIDIG
jgi:hypothetical protein